MKAKRKTPRDGGPAYPRIASSRRLGDAIDTVAYDGADGLTVRQHFVGMALAAKTADGLIGYEDQAPAHRKELIRRLVRDCYEIADEMLAQGEAA